MSEMVERVAKAMARKIRTEYPDNIRTEAVENIWRYYLPMARAAIEAMRVPTEAMEDAGTDVGPDRGPTNYYHAMIDAALANEPVTSE